MINPFIRGCQWQVGFVGICLSEPFLECFKNFHSKSAHKKRKDAETPLNSVATYRNAFDLLSLTNDHPPLSFRAVMAASVCISRSDRPTKIGLMNSSASTSANTKSSRRASSSVLKSFIGSLRICTRNVLLKTYSIATCWPMYGCCGINRTANVPDTPTRVNKKYNTPTLIGMLFSTNLYKLGQSINSHAKATKTGAQNAEAIPIIGIFGRSLPARIESTNASLGAMRRHNEHHFTKSQLTGNAPKWVDEKSLGRPFNSTGMRFPPYCQKTGVTK